MVGVLKGDKMQSLVSCFVHVWIMFLCLCPSEPVFLCGPSLTVLMTQSVQYMGDVLLQWWCINNWEILNVINHEATALSWYRNHYDRLQSLFVCCSCGWSLGPWLAGTCLNLCVECTCTGVYFPGLSQTLTTHFTTYLSSIQNPPDATRTYVSSFITSDS